ncbi:MAG: NAD-binding protein, partial [Alphaproteobacteria bacterium]|nr:NAD-binding protein [Alphaproteobacteria bacterium]
MQIFDRHPIRNIVERARTLLHRLAIALRTRYWFPHVPLAVLFTLGGYWLLAFDLGSGWPNYLERVAVGSAELPPKLLPVLLVGGGMMPVGLGLLFRSRVAWTMALILAIAAGAITGLGAVHSGVGLLAYFALMVFLLIVAWNRFDRASLAASTLFAITSVLMLLMYATYGAFYLGVDFKPKITDLITAFYFAVVSMSTVGYGDITPQTPEARLFAVSVILLGVAVFATSLTAVIAPLVSNSITRIVTRRGLGMTRSNHFIVIGRTALAVNTWRELAKRGRSVTRIVREMPEETGAGECDLVVGDPSSVSVLKEAGAEKAQAVLAMTDDDSENAFIVLAVRELAPKTRTIAAINDAHHMGRIRLVQPDVTIAPQVLGGELLAMM